MPKKTTDVGAGDSDSLKRGDPPPLSEKLIAQLQGAVSAARRARAARPLQRVDLDVECPPAESQGSATEPPGATET